MSASWSRELVRSRPTGIAQPHPDEGARQLMLPTFNADIIRQSTLDECPADHTDVYLAHDPLVTTYLRRLDARGVAEAGGEAYRYQLTSMLRSAARLVDEVVTLSDLFHDPNLLGRVLVDDTAPVRGGTLSKWTLAQRRSAARSFGSLMQHEMRETIGTEPLERIDEALRLVAERVGTGYRLSGGKPRQRGGYVPASSEVAAVIEAASQVSGYRGTRNRGFFDILAHTGTRVNALRQLNGDGCIEMPSGRLRIFVHDKGKSEPREVELTLDQSAWLRQYIEVFNQFAAGRRWKTRISLGAPTPVWRNSSRGRWPYQAVLATLAQACSEAGVPAFSPHALRRAFATDATSVLPRHVVALAGGWQGLERLDDHYVRPRQRELWDKLGWSMSDEADRWMNEQFDDAATVVPRT